MKNNSKGNIIVTHRLFPGVGQDLCKYFRDKGIPVLLVEHSFMFYPNRKTTFSLFDGQKKIIRNGLDYKFLPDLICYSKDFIYSLYAAIRYPYSYRIYFGCGGFNVIPGLILKLCRRVNKVIFYTIDFVPLRFNNSFLNKIYMAIDKVSVTFADRTWNLSRRMAEGREKYNNMPVSKFDRQRVVPVGIWLSELPQERNKVVNEKKLIFCGDLTEAQGLELVLESIPEIVEQIPDFRLTVIGDGSQKDSLINLAKSLNIEKYVEFSGAIYDYKALLKILCTARIGIAPYKAGGEASVYFADVTKPKTYLSCGLPVIITKFPAISETISKRNMGIVIDYEREGLINAVVKLMTDDNLYLICKKNAEEFILELDWNRIFDRALKEIKNA